VVSADADFEAFKDGLFEYIDQFESDKYVKLICTRSQLDNPFAFAWSTDRNYAKIYLKVFRKAVVQMPAKDYNELLSRGLLDPHHTIGRHQCNALCLILTPSFLRRAVSGATSCCDPSAWKTRNTGSCLASQEAAQYLHGNPCACTTWVAYWR
jgi:hypothetical protein